MGFSQELKNLYFGLDVGQKVDRSVLTLLEKYQEYGHDAFEGKNTVGRPYYKLVYMDRFPINMPTPQQVDRVLMTYNRVVEKYNEDPPPGKKSLIKPVLVMDLGNVGRSLFDSFCQARSDTYGRMDVKGINFLGDGAQVSQSGNVFGVPKKDLASALNVVVENDRLIIPPNLPGRNILIKELSTFTWKISQAGNTMVEHLKAGDHDDAVCSLMCAIWYAEEIGKKQVTPEMIKALAELRNTM